MVKRGVLTKSLTKDNIQCKSDFTMKIIIWHTPACFATCECVQLNIEPLFGNILIYKLLNTSFFRRSWQSKYLCFCRQALSDLASRYLEVTDHVRKGRLLPGGVLFSEVDDIVSPDQLKVNSRTYTLLNWDWNIEIWDQFSKTEDYWISRCLGSIVW